MTSVWGELRRRNVVKVAVAYAIVGWLLIEVASTVLPTFQAPLWALQTITFVIILGFPLALILSWVFDLTPQGVARTAAGPQPESTSNVAGRKPDFVIIGVLAIAVAFFAIDRFVLVAEAPSPAAATVDPRSVAALPFSNESAEEENAEFFANGIHDNLLTQLAKISSLKVISRTSVMEYRDTTKNMREIGRELGVATILEGGVQRAGDAVQINVQLIDAETDEHLWAETYERQLTAENVFAIQREMATAIAETLQATLLPEEVARLNEIPTQSTQAWDFYVSGKEYARRADEQTFMPLALQQYERAVQADPQFALAWAALSSAHSEMMWGVDSSESRRQMAEEALQEAQRLAPDSPETHLAVSSLHYFTADDFDSALDELAIAEQGMRGDSRIFGRQGGALRRMGRWEESLAAWARAYELDPRNIDQLENYAETHNYLRNYVEAEELYDRILEIAPDSATVYFDKLSIPLHRDGDASALRAAAENSMISLGRFRQLAGWTAAFHEREYDSAIDYLDDWQVEVEGWRGLPGSSYYGITHQFAGQPELAEPYLVTAREELEEALDREPDNAFFQIYLAEVLVHLGDSESAIRMARESIDLLPASRDALLGPFIQVSAAVKVFLPAGEYEAAIRELDLLFSAPSPWSIEGLSTDPRIDPIRDDPRFQELVEKYRRQ